MYEGMTFEGILQRMLDKIPSTMDKREGSIIYDALAPAAVELQLLYIELDVILKETFGDTATREYLIRRAAERGIVPLSATYAVLKGEFNMDVPIGARFNCSELNYIVTEKIVDGQFKLQCESLGVVGNKNFGNLIPIDYINGLETATLTDLLIPGEDEEDTEVFRKRYMNSFDNLAFGGNIADYKAKTALIDGVGGVKVYPVWNGGGTVKLVLLDSANHKPSAELIDTVQTIIDPTQNQGEGVGIAPIGHVVTVAGCEETTVNIQSKITLQAGWVWEDIESYVIESIDAYFEELAAAWSESENIIVRVSQIETRLLNLAGVLDIADTSLNGNKYNLMIEADNIPRRGTVENVTT